jgi:hypothetical protein
MIVWRAEGRHAVCHVTAPGLSIVDVDGNNLRAADAVSGRLQVLSRQ